MLPNGELSGRITRHHGPAQQAEGADTAPDRAVGAIRTGSGIVLRSVTPNLSRRRLPCRSVRKADLRLFAQQADQRGGHSVPGLAGKPATPSVSPGLVSSKSQFA